MSYDLMVFDLNVAPKNKIEFMEWYESQTEWEEEHDYDDPKVSSEKLNNWFMEMINHFPAMNGPYSIQDDDNDKITDYSIGSSVIYAAFSWSLVEPAYKKMFELAEKHQVGFFDASSDEAYLWYINSEDKLELLS